MTFHPILTTPPADVALLVRTGTSMCFAAHHRLRWRRLPDGKDLPSPDVWARANQEHTP